MNSGRYVLSQVLEHIHRQTLKRLSARSGTERARETFWLLAASIMHLVIFMTFMDFDFAPDRLGLSRRKWQRAFGCDILRP